MKRVNLDDEYEKWLKAEESHLRDDFDSINGFDEFVGSRWKVYQDENGLIDKSNEVD